MNNKLVNNSDNFETFHLPKRHSAIVNGRSYGPYSSEIELVRNLPVNLKNYNVINSMPNWDCSIPENDRKFCFKHTWKLNTELA